MAALHTHQVPALVAELLAEPERVRLVLIVHEEADGSRIGQGLAHPDLSLRDLEVAQLNLDRARERFLAHAS